jgi:excisionase family DNA binding protein
MSENSSKLLGEPDWLKELRAESEWADRLEAYPADWLDDLVRDRRRKPRVTPPNGLRTLAEAAERIGVSVKTLKKHIDAGRLRYINVGTGVRHKRRMFTDADLDEFVAAQSRRDSPACPSTRTSARRIGNSTSSGEVIAFTAQPRPQTSAKPKK